MAPVTSMLGSTPGVKNRQVLLVGMFACVAVEVLAVIAWFALPALSPEWVCRNSPWINPVMRAAINLEVAHGSGRRKLAEWTKKGGNRWDQIIPFFKSPDHYTQYLALGAMANVTLKPSAVEMALFDLLKVNDSNLRKIVILTLGIRSLAALEARPVDSDPEIAQEIAERIQGLKRRYPDGPPP